MQNIEALIQEEFRKNYIRQKEYYELLKLEIEVSKLEGSYERVKEESNNLENQIRQYQSEIEFYKSRIHRVSEEQQHYYKEYNKILQSTSWKLMAPMRALGSSIKKVLGR